MLMVVMMQEMQGLASIEDAESFMLKHGENIVDILGGEVDRIEKNLKVQWLRLPFLQLQTTPQQQQPPSNSHYTGLLC